MQDFSSETFFFAQQSQQQVLGPDMFMGKALGFLSGVSKHSLAFIAQRKINRGRNFFANGGMAFDLLANGFDRGVGTQKTVGQRLIFAQQA